MPELIYKQSALSVCKEYCWLDDEDFIEGYNTAIKDIREAINELPTVKPEVRHGRWIRNATSEGYHCSNCGHHVDSPIGEMIDPRDYKYFLDKYCGGCGARMDAEDINVLTSDGGAENG